MNKKHQLISQNVPEGKIVEIFGQDNVGKTYTILRLISDLKNKICLYVDADRDLTREKLLKYGLSDRVIIVQPDSIEQTVNIIQQYLSVIDIIVVDSTANLLPGNFKDTPVNMISWKDRVKGISVLLQRIVPLCDINKIITIFVSQNRYDKDGNSYTTGGKALRFAATIRLQVTEDDLKIVKNKTSVTILSSR